MKSISRKLVAGAVLSGVFGLANAAECNDVLDSYGYYSQFGYSEYADEIVQNHPECFPGGGATSNTQIAATAGILSGANSKAVTGRLLSPEGSPIAIASTTA